MVSKIYVHAIRRMERSAIKRNIKRRMKAVCIKNSWFPLTQGKPYEVIDSKQTPEQERPHMYKIINDDDKQRWYDKSMFITLEEWRDQQLNEILQ